MNEKQLKKNSRRNGRNIATGKKRHGEHKQGGKRMKIEYKNKKLKLPYDLTAGEMSTELVTRQNPFSGQSQ